ncbi:MAG: hypothetical protein KJP09_03820 [Bacteroidia bacterium]|nr:hypothetical protein [Bacteroidia bacterium]NND10450.1 hypothetical protein [Flavobacteriaceae bacterium]NNK27129.1 hypothetical protein [Flavobacteriaceae bacterium]RZV65963.1 MAG: hypothetical protein EX254_04395 [Flavobacteriaceae bacterium]
MSRSIIAFLIKLVVFSLLLWATHNYILEQFFEGDLQIPLWLIYAFNFVMVFLVFSALRYYSDKGKDMLKLFLSFTGLKMVLAIVLLLPLFLKKSEHAQLEVFNFFIPYFLFLTFEIFSLNNFLQKS